MSRSDFVCPPKAKLKPSASGSDFGEEEQRNDAKFSGGYPEMERVEFAPAMA